MYRKYRVLRREMKIPKSKAKDGFQSKESAGNIQFVQKCRNCRKY